MMGRLGPDALARRRARRDASFLFRHLRDRRGLRGGADGGARARHPQLLGARGPPHRSPGPVERDRDRHSRLGRFSGLPGRSISRSARSPTSRRSAARYMATLQWSFLPFIAYIAMRNFIAAVERPLWGLWAGLIGFVGECACRLVPDLRRARLSAPGAFRRRHRHDRLIDCDVRRACARCRCSTGNSAAITSSAASGGPTGHASVSSGRSGCRSPQRSSSRFRFSMRAVILMGLIGKTALAAHSIAIQIASVTFMVPLGFGQAVTVRVGRAYGAGDRAAITRAGWTAFAMGVGFMGFTACMMLFAPRLLIARIPGRSAAGEPAGRRACRDLSCDRRGFPARRRGAGGRLRHVARPARYARAYASSPGSAIGGSAFRSASCSVSR